MSDIQTTTQYIITTYEIERIQGIIDGLRALESANAQRIAELETERNGLLAELGISQDQVAELQAWNTQLQVDLAACQAGHEEPPPPPVQERLRVNALGQLIGTDGRRAGGGIESLLGNMGLADPELFAARQVALGADIISPLPQGRWATLGLDLEAHRRYCAAIAATGAKHGYNVDNLLQDGIGVPGRQWLLSPAVVEMCNSFPNIFIECEVETGWGQNATSWRDSVIAMVLELRAAGHLNPIKVGSPDGGRSPRYAVERGHEVVQADPLHQVIFSWQAYWGLGPNSSGWSYQLANGLSQNIAGTLTMAQQIKDSGLCFVVGVESHDDIGATGWEQLIPKLNELQIAWQWWVLHNPGNGSDPTRLSDSASASTLRPLAHQVAALFPKV